MPANIPPYNEAHHRMKETLKNEGFLSPKEMFYLMEWIERIDASTIALAQSIQDHVSTMHPESVVKTDMPPAPLNES